MGSLPHQLHFVLIPFMGQGHLIPMVDIARLLASRGVIATIITTPLNAIRFSQITDRAIESGLPIQVLQVPFPSREAGLPQDCETLDTVPTLESFRNFMVAASMLEQPLNQIFQKLQPLPNCMIADKYLSCTASVAKNFGIPRIVFDGTSCFNLLCEHNLHISKAYEGIPYSEPFVVPGMPDHIEFTRSQLSSPFNPGSLSSQDMKEKRDKVKQTQSEAYGVLVNSFEELEPGYVEGYKKVTGAKIWCIGPVSLCNKEVIDMSQRGNKASIKEDCVLKWLDSKKPSSVIYASLGSLARFTSPQLVELGLGLEASRKPFIWVIKGGERKEAMDKWLAEEGFEERNKERGLVIRGWAPQLLILSHQAIGGFLTHCGWNSTLEGVCAGLPMVTWPVFSDQFYNEKLAVQVLRIGIGVGAAEVVHLGEEERFGVMVKREDIRKGVEAVMMDDEEGQERRKRAKQLQEMAKKAMEASSSTWSSYNNLSLLIEDIMLHVAKNEVKLG